MKKELTVLSLFDGVSGAHVALERAGFKIRKYYASEIDPHAIAITQFNYPDTIQLGDVTNYREWDINWGEIDLLIGGSPCTNLSNAGNGEGLEGSQSKLFYSYVKIKKFMEFVSTATQRPFYFLLENVKMKREWETVMTEKMGVAPIMIDSALVSAQQRKRLYWTNIPNIAQPEDKGILLRDVLFSDVIPLAIHNVYGGFNEDSLRVFIDKSPTIRANSGGGSIPSALKIEALAISDDGLAYMNRTVRDGRTHWDFKHHSDVNDDKSATVVANWAKGVPYNVLRDKNFIREFHPIEVERLQTFPDNFTKYGAYEKGVKEVSKTQRLKAMGNSFTVDVISHILSNIK